MALAGACGGASTEAPPTPPASCTGELQATLGTGIEAFEAVAEGDPLTMVAGPTGTWHLTAAMQLSGVSDAAKFEGWVSVATTGEDLSAGSAPVNRELAAYDPTTCTGEALDVRLYLDISPAERDRLCDLDGSTLMVSMGATDLQTQSTVTVDRSVVARLDPLDVPLCP